MFHLSPSVTGRFPFDDPRSNPKLVLRAGVVVFHHPAARMRNSTSSFSRIRAAILG